MVVNHLIKAQRVRIYHLSFYVYFRIARNIPNHYGQSPENSIQCRKLNNPHPADDRKILLTEIKLKAGDRPATIVLCDLKTYFESRG
jgi:hypothetical protein